MTLMDQLISENTKTIQKDKKISDEENNRLQLNMQNVIKRLGTNFPKYIQEERINDITTAELSRTQMMG